MITGLLFYANYRMLPSTLNIDKTSTELKPMLLKKKIRGVSKDEKIFK